MWLPIGLRLPVVGSEISNLLLILMIMLSIQCPQICVGQLTSC